MKTIIKFLVFSALLLQVPAIAEESNAKMEIEAMLRNVDSYEYRLVGARLLRPIDDALLKQLVVNPEETSEHDFALSAWLLRIAAEGNRKYLWLLDSKELKKGGDRGKEEIIDILLAYDYNVNGNKKTLDRLLDRVRKRRDQGEGWDSAFALGAVNEWNLCKQTLAGLSGGDGAGGDERYGFWLTRRYFFPDNKEFPNNYQTFCRDQRQPQANAEQDGTGQPATRPESKPEGSDKPQPEAEGRSR
jgi:hypothetical protein